VPFTEANGVRLYYEIEGTGPRLLCISGTGSDLRNRPRLSDGPIAAQFEALIYDQRGLGQSGVPEGPYSMAQYADDAAALLDAVGWKDCLVFGASFGGMVAQELALRHPGRVRRLVLACTSSGGAGGSSYPLHEMAALAVDQRFIRQLEITDTRWDEAWRAEHPAQVDVFRDLFKPDAPDVTDEATRGAALQLEARRHHDTADRLGQISCPTLIAAGRFDGLAPPANSEFLAQAIPGAELAFFDGGHIFLLQDPTALPAVIAFLSRGEDG
jgi:3-oxoadipate enol-lactonase